ncbi:MAG: extracellular solute-binding protein family 1 [Dehalococcoidia bacterium]|nr:extracellular solute-binding protein family 1 [Dehalococcoidia bacterium]
MRKAQIIGALVVVVAFTLAACAPKAAPAPAPAPLAPPVAVPAAPQGEWDKVLAAAKQEGTVTVYNVFGAVMGQALVEGMKKYGIKVENVGGIGTELELKIKTEQQAKAYVADVFVGGWVNQWNLSQLGLGQAVEVALPSLEEKDVWRMSPGKYDPRKSAYVINSSVDPTFIVNTDLVRPGEIQSWQDLLNPQWRGKMILQDPRPGAGPGTSGFFATMSLGEEYWKKVAAQGLVLIPSYDLTVQQVVHGEKALAIFPARSRVVPAVRAGAPIQIVHPKEGALWSINGVIIVKNAPHPNASLVLLDWIFTKEGQAAMGKALEASSIRKDVVPTWLTIREMRPEFFTLQENPTNLDPANSPKAAEVAKTIFGAR